MPPGADNKLGSSRIRAELHVLRIGSGPFGQTLLNNARQLSADLLVMGAYAHSPLLDTLRLSSAQEVATNDEQIGWHAGHKQALCVLLQPAVAHLRKAEDALDHSDRVLDLRPHLGLYAILGPLSLVDDAPAAGAAVGEVLCRRSLLVNGIALTLVGLIAPYAGLIPGEQIGE